MSGRQKQGSQAAGPPPSEAGLTAWMLLLHPGCARSLPAQLLLGMTKSAARRTVPSTRGVKFPPAQTGSPNRRGALAEGHRGARTHPGEQEQVCPLSRSETVSIFLWGDSCDLQPEYTTHPRPCPLPAGTWKVPALGDSSLGRPGPGSPRSVRSPRSTSSLRVPPLHPASCPRTRGPFLAELNTNHSAQGNLDFAVLISQRNKRRNRNEAASPRR